MLVVESWMVMSVAIAMVMAVITPLRKDHDPWNYIFFLQYLKTKSPSEYTGFESYVHDCFSKETRYEFIPLQTCRALQSKGEKKDGDVKQAVRDPILI